MVGVLEDRPHLVVSETPGDIRVVPEMVEAMGCGIQAIETTAGGAHPERATVVLQNGAHLEVTQAGGLGWILAEMLESLAVVAQEVKAAVGAHPEPTLAVDVDGVDPIVAETSW